jgi:hypothetical protein
VKVEGKNMKGLVIQSPHIDEILVGNKSWEIRGSRTSVRGPIALIKSGSGLVVGACDLVGVEGPLSLAQLAASIAKHLIPLSAIPAVFHRYHERPYAWVLDHASPLTAPIPYRHPMGAVIWVKLDASVASLIQ